MKKNKTLFWGLLFFVLFCLPVHVVSNNIQFITGAPTGAPSEPIYGEEESTSVDWFSEPIDGNYYFASLAPLRQPTGGSSPGKTIAIYRFIPGNPPTAGTLEFVASAPTGQCIFDQFSSEDACDESFIDVRSVSWYPSSINGEYFFTVVGMNQPSRLGLPGEQTVRLYRFNPDSMNPSHGTIDFIDSAPLQVSENEPSFFLVISVDWFSDAINGLYYFSAVGDLSGDEPRVRVYSFDPTAPLGTNISFVGAGGTEINSVYRSVDWLPELINGDSYFATGARIGGDGLIEVYQFCTSPCTGTDESPANHVRPIATAPTSAVLDFSINRVHSVEWLVVNSRYYLAAAVEEDFLLPPLQKQQTIRIYEFIPGKKDPTQGSLRFVTSAPTDRECCSNQLVDDNFNDPNSLDWLTQNDRYFLVVGGGRGEAKRSLLDSNSIRIYEFDANKEKLSFIAAEELILDLALSVDWFPGLIDRNNYFAAGISKDSSSGSEDKEVRVYKFRPPCTFAGLSC